MSRQRYTPEFKDEAVRQVTEKGHALVTRDGKARPRKVTIGSGTMAVTAPRVRDQRVDENGARCRFTSEILPPYVPGRPRSRKTEAHVPNPNWGFEWWRRYYDRIMDWWYAP